MTRHNADPLLAVIEPVKAAARQASANLRSAGVPHALIGGIGVSAYAPPRATTDVDFLIASDALSRIAEGSPLSPPVRGKTVDVDGVAVDVMIPPIARAGMERALLSPVMIDGLPYLHPAPLIALKMHAARLKDQGDIAEMIKAGLVNVDFVRKWLDRYLPDTVDDFDSLVLTAQWEARGAGGAGRRNPKPRRR